MLLDDFHKQCWKGRCVPLCFGRGDVLHKLGWPADLLIIGILSVMDGYGSIPTIVLPLLSKQCWKFVRHKTDKNPDGICVYHSPTIAVVNVVVPFSNMLTCQWSKNMGCQHALDTRTVLTPISASACHLHGLPPLPSCMVSKSTIAP